MNSRVKMMSVAPRKNNPSGDEPRSPSHHSLRPCGFAIGLDQSPIYYESSGHGSRTDDARPVLALLDGIGCDGYIWKYLGPALAANFRVVHMHYRGHGRTPAPRDRMRVDIVDLADDLAQVLDDALDIDRDAGDPSPPTFLLGHSMGVQVALEFYRRYRERVAGLCLMCGSYGTPLRTFKGQATLEQLLPFVQVTAGLIPGLVAGIWKTVIPTELSYQIATRFELNGELIRREDFFPYLQHMAQVDTRLFLTMLAAAGRHSAQEILDHVDVPTLIVAGDRDGFTPPALSDEMHRRVKSSEIFVVKDGSHSAPIERPEIVTATVTDFLQRRVVALKSGATPPPITLSSPSLELPGPDSRLGSG